MSTLQIARVRATSSFGRLQVANVRLSGVEPVKVSTLQIGGVRVFGATLPTTLQVSRIRVSGDVNPPKLQISRVKLTGAEITASENLGFYLYVDGSLIPIRLDWWASGVLTPIGNNV